MSAINSTMRVPASTQTRGNLIQRHQLFTLVSLIYVFEWIVLVPQALESQGLLPFKIPALLAFAVGWGPALAAFIVTLLHASQNTWANLLSDNQAAPFYLTVGLLAIVAVALVIIYGAQNLSRHPRVEITSASVQHQPAVRRGCFSAG